jgi:hypothetical protein
MATNQKKGNGATRRRSVRPSLQNDQHENVKGLERKVRRMKPDWRAEQLAADLYFTKRTARLKIIATTKTPGGQILDWIEPATQVSSKRIPQPPSESVPLPEPSKQRRSKPVQFELENPEVARGPAGTVPILRRDPRKIRVSTTLRALLSKHGLTKLFHPLTADQQQIEVPGDGAHDYAYTAQWRLGAPFVYLLHD